MEKISLAPEWVFSPQPMYMIGTNNEDGTANICVITWLGFSFDGGPHLMMTMGGNKLPKTNILREKTFSAGLITEDTLWLADYFGSTRGEDGPKNALPFRTERGAVLDVPVIGECPWIYECEVTKVIELEGAHLFLAAIRNIQISREYADMDLKKIDLTRLRPAVYAPYNYFSIGEKLGSMGEWREHFPDKQA